jgi:hypothetical protein
MQKTTVNSNFRRNSLDIIKEGKKLLVTYIALSIVILIFASLALSSQKNAADLLAYIAIIATILSLILNVVAIYYIFIPLIQSLESERIRDIEVKFEKFYVPLYNLLTSNNKITNYQEKINEINCYIHLAESCTRYRFKTYKKTNWFLDDLVEGIKKDMENYQKEYAELKENLS